MEYKKNIKRFFNLNQKSKCDLIGTVSRASSLLLLLPRTRLHQCLSIIFIEYPVPTDSGKPLDQVFKFAILLSDQHIHIEMGQLELECN